MIVLLFPLSNWCQLIPKSKKALSMMRQCCCNPTLLEYAALNGCYYFDATLMARPSKKKLYVKLGKITSWGIKTLNIWYMGPTIDQY